MLACMLDVRVGDRACLCFVLRASLVSVCMMTESVCLNVIGRIWGFPMWSYCLNCLVRMTSWVAVRVNVGMRLMMLLLLLLLLMSFICLCKSAAENVMFESWKI